MNGATGVCVLCGGAGARLPPDKEIGRGYGRGLWRGGGRGRTEVGMGFSWIKMENEMEGMRKAYG